MATKYKCHLLVYAFDTMAGQKHETAKALVQSLWQLKQGNLSIQVLQEFFATVTRKVVAHLPEVVV